MSFVYLFLLDIYTFNKLLLMLVIREIEIIRVCFVVSLCYCISRLFNVQLICGLIECTVVLKQYIANYITVEYYFPLNDKFTTEGTVICS